MATVYFARRRGPGGFENRVALKLTHTHLREQPEWVTLLIREAKLAARIRHPNVVQILDVDDDVEGVFLVMEYIEGDSLAAIAHRVAAKGERVPMPIASRILDDALAGLHCAHSLKDDGGRPLGVVHRDFSPQNILVGVDGITRLTDFGIAKMADSAGFTHTGIVKGKTAYMSPQQAQGQPIDRRADVWSAGVVAWELFAGRRLSPPGNEAATLLKLVTQVSPRLRSIRPDIPDALDDVVADALELDPARRLPTADAFRERLRAAVSELAEPAEVGAYVMRVMGEEVTARRALADVMPSLPPEAPSQLEAPTSRPGSRASWHSAPAIAGDGAPPLTTTEIKRGRITPHVFAAAFGSTLALLFLGMLIAGRAMRSSRTLAAASIAAPAVSAPTETLEIVEAVAPPAANPTVSQRRLKVSANAPIARVTVNGRAVTPDMAAREVLVTLEGPEVDVDLQITAATTDGRTARASVPAGAGAATLAFRRATVGANAPSVLPPLVTAPPSAPAATAPKLHPSPYTSNR
jgi:serine/threonine-protein kinase